MGGWIFKIKVDFNVRCITKISLSDNSVYQVQPGKLPFPPEILLQGPNFFLSEDIKFSNESNHALNIVSPKKRVCPW